MPGEKGMDDMKALMAGFAAARPPTLAGMKVAQVRDYLHGTVTAPGGRAAAAGRPVGDLVIFDLEPAGNYVAVRPSGHGAEGEVLHVRLRPAGGRSGPGGVKAAQATRLRAMESDLRAIAGV